MTTSEKSPVCPSCGESVKAHWKFCPACESSLQPPVCPQCKIEVQDKWKICPECGTRLLCKSCNRRIPPGHSTCPECKPVDQPKPESKQMVVEPTTGMEFVHVPAGGFMMGDTFEEGLDNEKPEHEVFLDDFYMGKFPVTQGQWKLLMKTDPANFRGDLLPVESITFEEVRAFVAVMNQAATGPYRFELPTEAQWEYAARSGGRSEKYSGADLADPVAWYNGNSEGRTHSVGQKAPNGLGLHDMSGNVWEWCLDKFRADAYKLHQKKNPICLDGKEDRVIRGGSWNIDEWSVRCARRYSFTEGFSAPGLGFRLVMIKTDR